MRVTPWLSLVGSGQFGLSSRYDCHLYLLRGPGGALLVDAGSGLGEDRILPRLRDELGDVTAGAILLSHGHPDHICGAGSLSSTLGWPVYASEQARPVIEQGDADGAGLTAAIVMGGYPETLTLSPCRVDEVYRDGLPFGVCGLTVLPIHVRGHSRDSYAFVVELGGLRVMLSADVLFYGGVLGLINSEGSELGGYRADLPKLASLEVDALLPAHGLFTLRQGQRHIDLAISQLKKGFTPRMIGQGDLIF